MDHQELSEVDYNLSLNPTQLILFVFCVLLVTQLCLTLCDPMDHGPPGSSFHGVLQAKILGWVSIPFSRVSSQPRNQIWVSCIKERKKERKNYCIAHRTLLNVMCQPAWEGDMGENGYVYMYGWVPSLFTQNYQNIANRLYSYKHVFGVKKI